MKPHELIQKFKLVSDQVDTRELLVILTELQRVLNQKVDGAVVEFGCYAGTTSLFITRILGQHREFHVYDSFAGLPEKTDQDTSPAGAQFKASELSVSKSTFIKNFKQAGLPLPAIHKGWFSDITDGEVPAPIAFAFLDGDFYESIKDSLRLIERKLAKGAVIVVDDYQSEALPGAKKAVDEWLRGKLYKLRIESSLAIIYT